MKNIFTVLIAALIVVAGGVWYFVSFRLDSAIEQQIEDIASASFGTRVSVGSVKTSIKDGSLTISNITVANPPGYNNENAFSLNGIEAAVDYDNFDIKRVVIDKPEIVIEEKAGESNFSELLANLEKSASEPAPAPEGGEEPVLTIRHFRMNQSRAAFESESLDQYTDLKVDAIELNGITGTPSEVSSAIASKVVNEIVSEAAKEIMKAKASEKIGDIFGKDKD